MSIHGFCPVCGKPGNGRERRPNGNDICEAGHTYPSRKAIKDSGLAKQIRVMYLLSKNNGKMLDELIERLEEPLDDLVD